MLQEAKFVCDLANGCEAYFQTAEHFVFMKTQNGGGKPGKLAKSGAARFLCANLLLFGLFSASATPGLYAFGSRMDLATNQAWSQDFVHGLVNFEFSNYHLTSRGINLQDEGLVFQPYVRLDWRLYKPQTIATQCINELTLMTAVWNDLDTRSSGVRPGHWNEIDPSVGPVVKLPGDWTLESPFIAFKSETGSYPTCWAWDPRLTYHDHFWGRFSINPYVEYFQELKNKITVVLVPATSERSYYGVVGLDPTYIFQQIPLKLELPTSMLIPGENFYQRKDGTGGGTDLGLFTTAIRATVPLDFMGSTYGKWSIYAGVQYDYLNNPGLLDGNEMAGAAHSRERNIVVLHGGITMKF